MVSVDIVEVGLRPSGEKMLSKFFVEGSLTGSQLVFRRETNSATGNVPYGFLNESKTELFVFPEGVYGPYISRNPVGVIVMPPSVQDLVESYL